MRAWFERIRSLLTWDTKLAVFLDELHDIPEVKVAVETVLKRYQDKETAVDKHNSRVAAANEAREMNVDDFRIAPCPFCDETERVETVSDRDHRETMVQCRNCGAHGPILSERQEYDDVHKMADRAAIEKWDRRAYSP